MIWQVEALGCAPYRAVGGASELQLLPHQCQIMTEDVIEVCLWTGLRFRLRMSPPTPPPRMRHERYAINSFERGHEKAQFESAKEEFRLVAFKYEWHEAIGSNVLMPITEEIEPLSRTHDTPTCLTQWLESLAN